MNIRQTMLASVAGAAIALSAGAAMAETVRIVIGVPDGSGAHYGIEKFSEDLAARTDGDLRVRVFPPSLLDLRQTFGGIRDGVVDGGYMVLNYFPAELPQAQLPIEMAMLGQNPYAMAGAMSEYILTCDACIEERLAANMVPLGNASTGAYAILGTAPMTTEAELQGKKLRAAGGAWSRWAAAMGAVGVSLSGNEIFEAVSQGTIDGAMNAPSELSSIRLIDVATNVTTNMPGGTVHGLDLMSVNRDFWRGLTDAQRRAYMDAAALANAATTWKFADDVASNLEMAKAQGITVSEASPEAKAMSDQVIQDDLSNIAQIAAETHGLDDVDTKIARFQELVTKWEGLLPLDRDWSPEEIAEVYRAEIFSKLDETTYGL
ncbi:Lactate-binding periplasmic protein precursor [Rhodobacteraceae bacterium THAF1]|uniref:C4-dicarboxylate TRAP transporter substrate-binding protein n=1 Tax=Palleronia sp. THAF1 TaxID=2587842 RepID=UPI000F3ED44B|nr:C4-dicarboxylate TRAP transporter substrate-binding protein [Palleronia sp. THAF1]QFU08775.1 Lactate-binding periplasmic protein precursor [Palleronia sp. THAF1]VDC31215.1 Lactate-binding periplasmic protein precursor [Rhodobacteraceae bacterium THAF1]